MQLTDWDATSSFSHAGTQLIRRNDELALLYEKIKILQSSLSRGQSQYRDRLNEIRILRIKLADLNRELTILKRSVADVNVLKREVHSLGRQLLQECTKVKALSEELENPLNVHRCPPLHIHALEPLFTRVDKSKGEVQRDLLIRWTDEADSGPITQIVLLGNHRHLHQKLDQTC